MSLFSGWGMRVNKPGVIKLRFQREADYCIRVIPFKLGTYDHQPQMVVYTYDNKIEDFSFNPLIPTSLFFLSRNGFFSISSSI